MKLWKIVLFALIAIASSCSIQKKPQIQITHVLAVTQQGDTLQIPIDAIRPVNYRIINYSSRYGWNNWYRPYYHNYIPSYSNGSNSRSSNNGSSKANYGNTPNKTSGNVNAKAIPLSDRSSANIKDPK